VLLLLAALNGSFLRFVARQDHGMGRLWLARLMAFLALRAVAWFLGLWYGLYLRFFNPEVVKEVAYSEE
jgi:hypothetical protein